MKSLHAEEYVPRRTTYAEGWRLYPWSMAGHHVQGFIASVFMLSSAFSLNVWGTGLLILYVAYQATSVLRKKDSPGLDIADFMVGYFVGGVAFAIWLIASILTS